MFAKKTNHFRMHVSNAPILPRFPDFFKQRINEMCQKCDLINFAFTLPGTS